MSLFYSTLKYLAVTLWSMFVIAPFLWALTTSFKDFQSVTSGATYIPWVDFEPTLELALERLSAENNFAGVNFMFLENSDHM